MKIIYTFLFFANTLVLLLLAFLLLRMIDNGITATRLIFMLSCILLSIALFIFLLSHYLKNPSSNSPK
jgi:hypothetical protein